MADAVALSARRCITVFSGSLSVVVVVVVSVFCRGAPSGRPSLAGVSVAGARAVAVISGHCKREGRSLRYEPLRFTPRISDLFFLHFSPGWESMWAGFFRALFFASV